MMSTIQSFSINAARLPDGQAGWAAALVNRITAMLDALSSEERAVYRQLWRLAATFNSPITSNHFADLKSSADRIHQILTDLNKTGLVWFDDDLRAVLRCPPFSALYTPHQVKAFGWERAYAASLIEAPLTLLVYGPNTWLKVQTTCPRSGEVLNFRVMVRDDDTLRMETAADAEQWVVWLPLPDNPLEDDVYGWLRESRLRIGAFYTQNDLDTHRYYEGGAAGVVYTLEQAIYLSECLLFGYKRTLAVR